MFDTISNLFRDFGTQRNVLFTIFGVSIISFGFILRPSHNFIIFRKENQEEQVRHAEEIAQFDQSLIIEDLRRRQAEEDARLQGETPIWQLDYIDWWEDYGQDVIASWPMYITAAVA
ncbi:8568_t:CDS:2 [Ambispora leptoticha]|uniref:8568_t:CDS:1 n=1 Tax=Ambispora leptoticha TaxID=144679 RepID=A0A9N9CD83_9GLOM|nr:8568_t:CDS:2 [Ambispora leptoticha]